MTFRKSKFWSLLLAYLFFLAALGIRPILPAGAVTQGVMPYPRFKGYVTGTNAPLSGGKLYTYLPGTTTPTTTYTTSAGDVANANPVILDANGEADVWFTGIIKIVLKDSDDVTIWTKDNVRTIGNLVGDGTESITGYSDITGSGTGRIKDYSIGSASYTDNGYFNDLITNGPWVDVRAHGAVGDGTTDDTAAVQAAIDNAIADGIGVVLFPQTVSGDYIITSKLTISSTIALVGQSQYYTRIVAIGCSGIEVAAGVANFRIENIEIAQAVRYTTTPNSYIGLQFLGSTGSRPQNAIIHNVYFDGFGTSIEGNWLWTSQFNNVSTSYTHVSLALYGLSEHNKISNCHLVADGTAGSRVLVLGDGSTASETLYITNSNLWLAEVVIESDGFAHVNITNSFIDEAKVTAISISAVGGSYGGSWLISNNFIGVTGADGYAGISITDNTVSSSQDAGIVISGNRFHAYNDGLNAANYGIVVTGQYAEKNIITGNNFVGFELNDIYVATGGLNTIITNNNCQSTTPTNNIYAPDGLISNNLGTVYYTRATTYTTIGKMKVTYDEAAPTVGTWNRGDICMNTAVSENGNYYAQPLLWYCGIASCTSAGEWSAVYPVTLGTPSSAAAVGKPGMIAVDNNYIYWNHPATDNTWLRAAGASW